MDRESLTIALIRDVFFDDDGKNRLITRLKEAKAGGAVLAVLPELPLHPWVPSTKERRDEDAEVLHGPRCKVQSEVARKVGLGLIGGAIVREPTTGKRYNTALVFDRVGELITTYRKAHIPEEPGFWETSHYEPGDDPPTVIDCFSVPFGVQICSDINRPEGCHVLGALGAEVVVVPRATEQATYPRWKIVFQANAITSCVYVVSVNRPGAEQGVKIGGPSIAVAPDGAIILESTDTIGLVTIDRNLVVQARQRYPGYLPTRSALYARGWQMAVEDRIRRDRGVTSGSHRPA